MSVETFLVALHRIVTSGDSDRNFWRLASRSSPLTRASFFAPRCLGGGSMRTLPIRPESTHTTWRSSTRSRSSSSNTLEKPLARRSQWMLRNESPIADALKTSVANLEWPALMYSRLKSAVILASGDPGATFPSQRNRTTAACNSSPVRGQRSLSITGLSRQSAKTGSPEDPARGATASNGDRSAGDCETLAECSNREVSFRMPRTGLLESVVDVCSLTRAEHCADMTCPLPTSPKAPAPSVLPPRDVLVKSLPSESRPPIKASRCVSAA
mmetsp:Transcript_45791/g.121451  ORF Transcript_45791/g.121451 Transcript_45791/m.121451 type:complete len:270 (-) Transcript_45791:70-879(-)